MKRDEILSEFKKGVRARKYNRHYINPDKESETMIAPRIPPKKKDDVKEQRSDYKKDEIVAILTGQKTQAEVDAEALRTRGPDKGSTATPATRPTTPTTKPVQTKETTGAPVGKITKVDPATKKATISKPDGTTQEIDSTALKPTPDGKMQMDAPDTDEIKTGTDVVSTEDALSPPGDSQSPIHGGGDHDEISKLLVQRLRKLAGLQEEPSPAPTAAPPAAPTAAPASQIPPDLTVVGMLDDPELDPQSKAYMQKILVAQPNGTVDLARTLRNISGEFIHFFPQLADVLKDLQVEVNNFVRTPEFSELAPADQNSIINLGKALPTSIQQIEATTMQLAKAHDKEFNKMDAATGQYGDGQVQEAGAKQPATIPELPVDKQTGMNRLDVAGTAGPNIPPMPDISGLQPGQKKDLGDGDKVEIGRDGNIHYSGGFGVVVYSPQGKPLSYDTPTFGGLKQKQDLSTGDTTTSYNVGPLSMSGTKNAQGQMTAAQGSYDTGDGTYGMAQDFRNGQPTIRTTTATGNAANRLPLVKNQDVLNRARQAQAQPTEDAQLEAMLRIAGLR